MSDAIGAYPLAKAQRVPTSKAVQIGTPTYGNTDGITNTSLPLTLCPVTGDDEIVIRIR